MNPSLYIHQFLFFALTLIIAGIGAGCGGDDHNPDGVSNADALREPSRALQREKGAKASERAVRITLLDKNTQKPVTGARVVLFYSPVDAPEEIQGINTATNLDGEALFEPGDTQALMYRSEYDFESHELTQHPTGITEITHRVVPETGLSGRVLDPAGQPIEGAVVFVTRQFQGQALGEGRAPVPGSSMDLNEFRRQFGYDMEAEVTTTGDGRFECTVKTRKPLLMAAHAPGLLSPSWRIVAFSPDADAYPDQEIRLRNEAKVHIQVYDARNQPLQNRTISLFETLRSAAERGEPGERALPLTVMLNSGPDGDVDLALPEGLTFEPQRFLLYPRPGEGEPIPNPIHDAPLHELKSSPERTTQVIALPPRTVRLHGSIRDAQGAPVHGAVIRLPVNTVTAGKDGSFSILVPYNVANPMGFTVTKQGYSMQTGLLPLIEKGKQELALDLVLQPERILTVSAGEDTRDLWMIPKDSEADFTVSDPKDMEILPRTDALIRGIPKGNGLFSFVDAAPGDYCVLAQMDRFHFTRYDALHVAATDERIDLAEAKTDITIDPLEPTWLVGKINDFEGKPHQWVDVTILRTDLREIRRWDPRSLGRGELAWDGVRVERDGSFEFRGLAPGRYAVAAAYGDWDGRIDIYTELQLKAGENTLELSRKADEESGAIEMIISDANSSPLADASLLLLDPVDSLLGRAGSRNPLSCSNGDGKIRLENLPPGRYGFALEYVVEKEHVIHARIRLRSGETSQLSLVLDPKE